MLKKYADDNKGFDLELYGSLLRKSLSTRQKRSMVIGNIIMK